ncbi:MAG: helix-turn-helix transcriptional regulator [Prolixibacteraceae bacterium]|nr:helix-turn-helix transcriptional regulator [Prolixibacteraceae bacterium]
MKSLAVISDEITVLEAERDFGDITPEGLEQLAVLNLCYDLLSRTQTAQSIPVPQSEEMKEPGFEDERVNKYGISGNALADFAFAVATKQGAVDLRELLQQIKYRKTNKEIAEALSIRPATLSDYKKGKSGLNSDIYEQIVNYCIK